MTPYNPIIRESDNPRIAGMARSYGTGAVPLVSGFYLPSSAVKPVLSRLERNAGRPYFFTARSQRRRYRR